MLIVSQMYDLCQSQRILTKYVFESGYFPTFDLNNFKLNPFYVFKRYT
jgi:hypothetical protein